MRLWQIFKLQIVWASVKQVLLKIFKFLVFVYIVVLQSTTVMENGRREKLCQDSLMLNFVYTYPTNC